MFKIIKSVKNPKFLIITPLKCGDSVSKNTLKTINQNRTQFDWITYTGNNNIPTNTVLALKEYEKSHKKLPYLIKVDAHTVWAENTLDLMYNCIKNSNKKVGYVYASFEFKNENLMPCALFCGIEFNDVRLKLSNFISSNSMIKRDVLKECPFITDSKYERLLDYAHWLSFLNKGYVGKLSEGYFYSIMKTDNISSGSQLDYLKKLKLVHRDFL